MLQVMKAIVLSIQLLQVKNQRSVLIVITLSTNNAWFCCPYVTACYRQHVYEWGVPIQVFCIIQYWRHPHMWGLKQLMLYMILQFLPKLIENVLMVSTWTTVLICADQSVESGTSIHSPPVIEWLASTSPLSLSAFWYVWPPLCGQFFDTKSCELPYQYWFSACDNLNSIIGLLSSQLKNSYL